MRYQWSVLLLALCGCAQRPTVQYQYEPRTNTKQGQSLEYNHGQATLVSEKPGSLLSLVVSRVASQTRLWLSLANLSDSKWTFFPESLQVYTQDCQGESVWTSALSAEEAIQIDRQNLLAQQSSERTSSFLVELAVNMAVAAMVDSVKPSSKLTDDVLAQQEQERQAFEYRANLTRQGYLTRQTLHPGQSLQGEMRFLSDALYMNQVEIHLPLPNHTRTALHFDSPAPYDCPKANEAEPIQADAP